MARDALGVLHVSAQDIERLCKRFLEYAAPSVLEAPMFTPLAYVFKKIEHYCTSSFDDDLGLHPNGLPILGSYSITRKHISISRTLTKDDPRFPFTCAHELGHFYLHRNVKIGAVQHEGDVEIRDSAQELVTYRVQGGAGRRIYIEWQANRFAAGILMPSVTVEKGLARVQRDLGIGRRGRVWLDHQRQSHRDYRSTVGRLSNLYKVSPAVVQFRLRELDLVDVDSTYGLTPIGDLTGKALRQLFGF